MGAADARVTRVIVDKFRTTILAASDPFSNA